MYDFKAIEKKWQKWWEDDNTFLTSEPVGDNKFYMLVMFAYPSGDIHIGHFRNYTIGDVMARFRTMQGCEVLHPFGWDAFGLPAEQAAIKHGMPPQEWTLKNIATSRNTLKKVGISYDWKREVATCLPDFYKWTQWAFLKLWERGLAYRKKALVNWCPECKTVLANEQIETGGCWRCHSQVEQKNLEQWFFKITEYADRLLDGLDELDQWPDNVRTMQRNWIGRSEGTEIDFVIEPLTGSQNQPTRKISVFTTRPDTIYGVTFMAIAPENPLAEALAKGTEHEKQVEEYIKKSLIKSQIERTAADREKDGVFTGRYAFNPFNGERVRLFVADYVLATYGTGIVMGVPAHDQRDFEFARKYDIPIRLVIEPPGEHLDPGTMEEAYVEPGLMANSNIFNGTPSQDGIAKVTSYAEEKKFGRATVEYRLRDWLISRQRYWGAPIPVIHCPACGVVPVPKKDLPILLPEGDIDFIPKGRSPLADVPSFVATVCPSCSGPARRDEDTMDTFVCSSWYHLRYPDAQNDGEPFTAERAREWLPVDLYVGGVEHACGHLIYFRFVTKVLYDLGYLTIQEPATVLFNHGMVLDENGDIMSKSKGNAVSPMEIMEEIGTDAARVAILFFAPPEKEILWSARAIKGSARFLNRLETAISKLAVDSRAAGPITDPAEAVLDIPTLSSYDTALYRKLNWAVKRVTEDNERIQFNTGIAALMELMNELDADKIQDADLKRITADRVARLLHPYAPHLAEELWEKLGGSGSIFKAGWPAFDEQALRVDEVEIAIQVNGKLRGSVMVPVDAARDTVEQAARDNQKAARHLEDKNVVKVIIVPNRIVNFVVK